MLFVRTGHLSAAQQRMHSAGTCPTCKGRGFRLLGLNHGTNVLQCGTCGGTGSSR